MVAGQGRIACLSVAVSLTIGSVKAIVQVGRLPKASGFFLCFRLSVGIILTGAP